MLAVFPCPDADEATFNSLQWGRAGGCLACTNEDAEQLKNWPNVSLFKDHSRVAVQLAWNTLRSRYVIVGSFLKEPADERPALDFLAGKMIPGIEHAGHVEIVRPRPADTMLRPSDFLVNEEPIGEPEPEEPYPEPQPFPPYPSPARPSDDFSTYLYACPHCDFRGPTAYRITRHIEYQHSSENEQHSAAVLAEQERERAAREELDRLADFDPSEDEKTDFGQLPPWQEEQVERRR